MHFQLPTFLIKNNMKGSIVWYDSLDFQYELLQWHVLSTVKWAIEDIMHITKST